MSKTAKEGAVEIVKSVSVEEWQTILVESTQTFAEAAEAISKFAQALGQAMDDVRESAEEFRDRWSEIKFTD